MSETNVDAMPDVPSEPVDLDQESEVPEHPEDEVLQRIVDFEGTLPELFSFWGSGDAAPEWMGPRPAWAEDFYHREERYSPRECFWQSHEIRMPVTGLYGNKSDDGRLRRMGYYEVFLRHRVCEREPIVVMRLGAESSRQLLPLTLSEVDDLVAALEMLTDIAKTTAVVDE